jgi:thioredoxin 1
LSETSTKPVHLTDSDYYSRMKTEGLMITDFWAAWCGPCRLIAPIIEELAKEYEGKVTFAKLNIDENPMTAQQLGIMSIPTMIVSRKGKIVDVLIGAMPKAMIKQKIDSYLRNPA